MMETEEITAEEDLLGSDLLDSMGVMRLVAFIEGEFEIKISPRDLTVENFTTVNRITDLIAHKQEVV